MKLITAIGLFICIISIYTIASVSQINLASGFTTLAIFLAFCLSLKKIDTQYEPVSFILLAQVLLFGIVSIFWSDYLYQVDRYGLSLVYVFNCFIFGLLRFVSLSLIYFGIKEPQLLSVNNRIWLQRVYYYFKPYKQ